MQTWSFRGSGEPAWVIASSNACERLGPDPRRALGPAAIRAASTGRTHDRTRPMLHRRKKALVNQAPSTHDPKRTNRYFVSIRLGAVFGVCSAGEITNVTQPFQPAGRFWLANS